MFSSAFFSHFLFHFTSLLLFCIICSTQHLHNGNAECAIENRIHSTPHHIVQCTHSIEHELILGDGWIWMKFDISWIPCECIIMKQRHYRLPTSAKCSYFLREYIRSFFFRKIHRLNSESHKHLITTNVAIIMVNVVIMNVQCSAFRTFVKFSKWARWCLGKANHSI